jgi:DnaK suppressor protein
LLTIHPRQENPMFVSLLQLMGFPMGNPVHSRAEEALSKKPVEAVSGVKSTKDHALASAIRRQEVKTTTKKDTKATPAKSSSPVAPKPTVKAVVKSVVKPAPKAAVKVPVKVPEKAPNKAPIKVAAKPASKAAPVAAAPQKTVAKSAAKEKVSSPMPPIAPKAAPAPVVVASSAVPQKAGRPSSRLAQLTVPSMAQSVASTAAKASYSQVISAPVIVPALPSSIKRDPKLANNWKTKPAADLTNDELMAMSDEDYMNDAQLAAFRAKLVVLKHDILANAGETTEHLREDTSVVPDPADRATIEEEHALELRTRDRERKLLKKIEQSIGRIDAGDYGYCDETGEPIGVGRLLARPTATLSLEAQQRRELKQKMFGD